MAKKPDTRKKYYKDGNPELYKWFSEATWKNMTDPEKEMWTPADDVEMAPIPKEVLDFKKEHEEVINKDTEVEGLKNELATLQKAYDLAMEENEKLKAEVESCKVKDPACCKSEKKEEKTTTEKVIPITEEEEKNIIKEELRKMGVKFAGNSRLDTLKRKLEEAKKE